MKIAVVGNGVMGKGIVEILLCYTKLAGIESIIWVSRDTESSVASTSLLSRKVGKFLKINPEIDFSPSESMEVLQITSDFNALKYTELVIEAVSEDKDVKRDIMSKIAAIVDDTTIVASNTSSLSITELAANFRKPENFVGLHFFNPAPMMSLVEVVRGLTTCEHVIEKIVVFSKSIGKEPVVVNEAPGFVVNRMLIPMINEAIAIYSEGVADIKQIDKAMKLGANHPIGPLSLSDLIGNDVVLSILETLYLETRDNKYRPHTLLKKYVRANKLGRKTKSGFYDY
jgi:3-hydroxybutyryl-CoA dehydrogenase